ncbi:MAG: LysR family transcriptional regulator [Pseudomonadales bacterium]|nr:LysR family transcriptional regulator [Pseudomonadales bacterium]NRA14599.1 LysR family transcriptional regulator [Oceanospirillaceae bacterium]
MNNAKLLPSLIIFGQVARQQSFTLAAKHLAMSKSAVSQQVTRLEKQLGQQLLSRHTRGMSLTPAGAKLLSRCELLSDQVELALAELSETRETPSGSFSLTIPHACEKSILLPALSQLCLEYPKLEPNIVVTDQVQDLIAHNLDVAIYAGELKDSNYRAMPIGSTGEVFCASASYVQKHPNVSLLVDLQRHKFISTSWQQAGVSVYHQDSPLQKALLNNSSPKLQTFAKANTLPCTLAMISAGMGIGLLPEFTLQTAFATGELVRVFPGYTGRQWPFYMVHRFLGEKPIHITRFHQLIKHYFARANILA